jgi:hypothetical protein
MLFAQRRGGPPPDAGAYLIIAVCCWGFFIIAGIAWAIFMYVSLYRAFNAISPHNRDMEPASIFLMLIPGFGGIWYFFVVIRLASSFANEFRERGLREDGDFGQLMGILVIIPCIGAICSVIWIMKVRGYTERLTRLGGNRADSFVDE